MKKLKLLKISMQTNKQALFTQSMQLCCFSIAQRERERKEQRKKMT